MDVILFEIGIRGRGIKAVPSCIAAELRSMTQEERWMVRYNEVMGFLEENHRNPSKYRIEEYDMLNWLKANRKVMNAGRMRTERVERFERLLSL